MNVARALPEELTIYTVTQLQPEWRSWLVGGDTPTAQPDGALEVAADAVAEVDAAGIQLLVSLANACALDHRPLHLLQPSAALVRACGALGVAQLLAATGGAAS